LESLKDWGIIWKISFIVQNNSQTMQKIVSMAAIAGIFALMAIPVGSAFAAQPPQTPPAKPIDEIWHNDQLWNTVVLGPLNGPVPDHTLDAFYLIDGQNPVAGAGPGDSDFNGGRWLPLPVSCDGGCPLFTDGDDVEAAIVAGIAEVGEPGTPFLCPLTNRNAEAP